MNRLLIHAHSDQKPRQPDTNSTDQTTIQEVHPRSTPRRPGHAIHSPTPIMHSQPKIQNQDQTLGADRCITILRGERADARRQRTTPRGDLVLICF